MICLIYKLQVSTTHLIKYNVNKMLDIVLYCGYISWCIKSHYNCKIGVLFTLFLQFHIKLIIPLVPPVPHAVDPRTTAWNQLVLLKIGEPMEPDD